MSEEEFDYASVVQGKRFITLGVIVGHTQKEPGAVLLKSGITEYAYNSSIAALCKKNETERVKVKVYYRDSIGISGAYQKAANDNCDCVIELHFNSFNKKETGTVTLCSPQADDVHFAKIVHEWLVILFGDNQRPNRGIIRLSNKDRGGRNVNLLPFIPNCLVEPAFGDVGSEEDLLLKLKEEYSKAIIVAASQWASGKGLI